MQLFAAICRYVKLFRAIYSFWELFQDISSYLDLFRPFPNFPIFFKIFLLFLLFLYSPRVSFTPPGVAGNPQSALGLTWCRRLGARLPLHRSYHHSAITNLTPSREVCLPNIRQDEKPRRQLGQTKKRVHNGDGQYAPSRMTDAIKRPQKVMNLQIKKLLQSQLKQNQT